MSSIELRYLASREWMESEILSGRAIQVRRHTLSVDLSSLPSSLASRIEAIDDGVMLLEVGDQERVCVLDSGIDPELSFGPAKEQTVPFDKPAIDAVGALPELPTPTEDVAAVVDAWEDWLERYKAKALQTIEQLNSDPPSVGVDVIRPHRSVSWGRKSLKFGAGLEASVSADDGALAMRDARAGWLWRWATNVRCSSEGIEAADEATALRSPEVEAWLAELDCDELASRFRQQMKKRYLTAKAYDAARRAVVSDFEVEMSRWARECGSDRLRLGIEDGYRMNARYLAERIAIEVPGMYAVPVSAVKDDWAVKAGSPSEAALRLRRRIAAAIARNAPSNHDDKPEVDVVMVRRPPHGIYEADPGIETEDGLVGTDLPSRLGWPWHLDSFGNPVGSDPEPFEAVVVRNWLGRFHLIGAVGDEHGSGPPGIWAVPSLELFEEDGTVVAQDPDGTLPIAAKRKPPGPPGGDDDTPF